LDDDRGLFVDISARVKGDYFYRLFVSNIKNTILTDAKPIDISDGLAPDFFGIPLIGKSIDRCDDLGANSKFEFR